MLKPLQRMITTEVAASDGARDILKRKEIGDFWVSSQSQWGGRFWQLDNETAGARAEVSRLHWDVALPDGSCLTDPQWAAQLETCRLHYEFGVALMSGAIANHNSRGAKTEETSRRSADQCRVRVHRTRQVFY